MSSNKHQTITTHEPSVMPPSRHASSPDVGINSSPQIPPPESKTGITLEAGTKPSIPSPAQGPTINTTPRCTFLQSPDQQQPLQGPTGLSVLLVPAAEERLRPIQQVSHGLLGYGHSHRRQSLQAIQLPQLSTIPTHTPVFAGAEGVEGRSPSLNLAPPRSAGQDSGLGSSVFDIDIAPPRTAGEQEADIELQSYPRGHGGHGRPHTGATNIKPHPDGPHHSRSTRKLSLTSFLVAAGLAQDKPSVVSPNTQFTVDDTNAASKDSTTTLAVSALPPLPLRRSQLLSNTRHKWHP